VIEPARSNTNKTAFLMLPSLTAGEDLSVR
jgi:hypothetical protein